MNIEMPGDDSEEARLAKDANQAIAFERTKQSLSAQFGITAAFVRVGELSKLMGLPANSIHALMRQRRFPIEHRRVGSMALVKFDDFIAWYCRGEPCQPQGAPEAVEPQASPETLGGGFHDAEQCAPEQMAAAFEETAKERAQRYKLEAHSSIKRRGLLG